MNTYRSKDIFDSMVNNTFVTKYINKDFIIKEDVTLPREILNLFGKCKKVTFEGEVRITSHKIMGQNGLFYDIDKKINFGNIVFLKECKLAKTKFYEK